MLASSLFGPLYALFVYDIDQKITSVSLSWFAFLLTSIVTMFFIRKWGDRVIEKENLLMGGYLVRAMVWLFFPFVGTIGWLVLFQAILGIGEAMGSPAFDAIFAKHLDKNKQVGEYTDWKIISSLIGAGAVLLGGWMVSLYGFGVMFFIMSMLALVSFFGILLSPRELL